MLNAHVARSGFRNVDNRNRHFKSLLCRFQSNAPGLSRKYSGDFTIHGDSGAANISGLGN